MEPWQTISTHISEAGGIDLGSHSQRSIGGGCINQAYLLEGRGGRYFVKLNHASGLDMFAAEAEGLREMAATASVRVPAPLCWGLAGNQAYLVMNYLELGGGGSKAVEQLGIQLAAMHRVNKSEFGWHRDNTIGSTCQPNQWAGEWTTFWREQRLGFQLKTAAHNGYGGALQRDGERLMADLDAFFSDYQPCPALLHGDLWSGNYAITRAGEPVIFDPAVYYGDREADIAMTELFGGFPTSFYRAYNEAWPLDSGYSVRKTFYNLYHIINHANLFGGGYVGQAERMIRALLGEIKG